MSFQPGFADATVVVLLAALTTAEVVIFWRLSRAPSSSARLRTYIFFICYQWLLAAGILALWMTSGRPWSALLLGAPHPIGSSICFALAIVYGVLSFAQLQRLNNPATTKKMRKQMTDFEWLVPHSATERRLWWVAAITAGCCEELFFRGFLFALATQYLPVIAAVLVTSALFGLYHAYYGPSGIAKTGAVGVVMSVVALASGSLLPAMLLHALIDLANGDAGYRVAVSTRAA